MTLHFIGLGLNDEKDITVKGLETVRKCQKIYLENYTSKLNCTIDRLEKLYKKKVIIADRKLVENQAEDTILKDAKTKKVAFLVIGDVFSATTHMDLFIRAKKDGIRTNVIHNASVITAVGITGLEIYKFGYTISIPFTNENLKSPVERFRNNYKNNLHTLFLLDIDPEKGRYMTASEGAGYLIRSRVNKNMPAIACAGLGGNDPIIKTGTLKGIADLILDIFPQSLIIPAKKLHFMEEEALHMDG